MSGSSCSLGARMWLVCAPDVEFVLACYGRCYEGLAEARCYARSAPSAAVSLSTCKDPARGIAFAYTPL